MHQAVELILARMKSHPEDFVYDPANGSGKWSRLISNYSLNFTDEEKNAIEDEYKKVNEWERSKRMDECTEEIYKLMTGDDSEEAALRFKTKGRYTQQILESGLDTFFKEEYNNAPRS